MKAKVYCRDCRFWRMEGGKLVCYEDRGKKELCTIKNKGNDCKKHEK